MRLLFMLVALLGVASASSNCPWKWCKDGKREAESSTSELSQDPPGTFPEDEEPPKAIAKREAKSSDLGLVKREVESAGEPTMPPWRKFGQKREAEKLEIADPPKPASPVGPPFMSKREAEELEIADPPKPASPVGPPFRVKKEAEELEIADPPKPASPVGPPFRAKKEAEELENPCFEQDPTLPSCRKFKRTVESPDKRAAQNDDRKEARLPPWRFEQKREAEELESDGDRKLASPVGPSVRKGRKRAAEEIEIRDKRAAEECDGVPPLPSCRKKFKKREAEGLENQTLE